MTEQAPSPRRAIGAQIRAEVLGGAYVKPSEGPASAFDTLFREFTEEFCWGNVWARPGLDRPTRSMLNLAMLSVMGRWHEFEVHVKGALNNGVSADQIAEVILQAGVYAGVPIAAEGMRRAKAVVEAYQAAKG